MKIETWNLKEGDPITVYTKAGSVYNAQILENIVEVYSTLYVKWECTPMMNGNFPHAYTTGSAIYNEPSNQWIVYWVDS